MTRKSLILSDIADLLEKLCAFKIKLIIFTTDMTATGVLHFHKVSPRAFMNTAAEAQITHDMPDLMTKLTENFTERFQEFNIPIKVLHCDLFTITPETDFCAEAIE